MDDENEKKVNINDYYSSVDKNILNNLCSNNNVKNLIYLSSQMDLNPFNKKNKKWQLKSKDKLIKECELVKKKKIKDLSVSLSNLAKLGPNNISEVKNIYKNFEIKIENLEKIITCVNHIESINNDITNKKTTYTIDHDPTSQSNIVSFDIIGGKKDDQTQVIKDEQTPKMKQPTPNIVEIKVINNIKSPIESSDNEDYLECYGNC